MFSPCFVIQYVVSFKFCTCNHLDGEKENCLLYFNCLLDGLYSQCSVALPDGAVGWSAMCGCGIS